METFYTEIPIFNKPKRDRNKIKYSPSAAAAKNMVLFSRDLSTF